MLEAVQNRLETQIPALSGRVNDAAKFTAMMKSSAGPQAMPAAYVLPAAMMGRQPQAAAGLFIQDYAEAISVVLFFGATSARASRALAHLRPFLFDVIQAIAGWTPGDTVGVFQLTRGAVLNVTDGRLIYQLDFSIMNQLRIAS